MTHGYSQQLAQYLGTLGIETHVWRTAYEGEAESGHEAHDDLSHEDHEVHEELFLYKKFFVTFVRFVPS